MSGIPKLNEEIMKACQLYVDNLIKPIHSLGKLEEWQSVSPAFGGK